MGRAPVLAWVVAVSLVSIPANAQVRDRRLRWHSIQTDHFEIAYPEPLGVLARRTAAVCERAHARLTTILGHPGDGPRTQVILTDETDSANGSATSLPYNQMRLFATAPEDISALSDFDDWLNILITHEHTHVLHLDTIGGLPSIVNRVLGKIWAPNLVQPRWFIEGLAVHEETRESSGGRLRSSMFRMFMRMDALEGRLLRMDQLSNTVDRWPRGNAPYLYGSHFVDWIATEHGRESLTEISQEYGRRAIPYGVNRVARHATGQTFEQLYDGWQAALIAEQEQLLETLQDEGIVAGRPLTSHGDIARAPRFLDDNTIVYYAQDGAHDPQLRRIRLDGTGVEQLTRVVGDAYASPTPNGNLVFGALDAHRDIYFLYDLFHHDVDTGEQERLTEGLRAREPDVSPDGRHVAFIRNGAGTTHLMIAELSDVMGTARVLLRSRRFEQVFTPRFSPDGRFVAISRWTHGGYRDIQIVEVDTGRTVRVTHDRAQDSGPAWSPDGRHLYFSSDRTGIANLYRYEIDSGDLERITNVIAGAYSPDVSPDGRTITYLGYSSFGWDIWTLDLAQVSPRQAAGYVDDRPDPAPEDLMVAPSERYRAARTLWPRSYLLDYAADSIGTQIGLTISQSDIADHYTYSARIGLTVPGAYTHLEGSFTFNRLPAPITVGAFRRFSQRGGLQVAGEDRTWIEDAVGLDIGASYRIPRALHSESISLSYSHTWLRQGEPFGGRLDPNTPPPVLPFTGRVAFLRMGWGYSDIRRRIYDMFPTAGRALALSLSLAHPVVGSEYRAATLQWNWRRHFEAPWKQHHAIAIRYGGGISGGDLGRRGVFSAGGFPGISIVDGLIDNVVLGGVALRGYPAGSRRGTRLQLIQLEYRVPLLRIMRGYQTLPAYLRRMHGTLFVDVGNAYNGRVDPAEFRVGVGVELHTDFVLGYVLPFHARLGFAYGFMDGGGVQGYFHIGVPF